MRPAVVMAAFSLARVLGFAPMDDFVGYLAACDIVLNLRYPTVGESSGTLLRALGLGKAVMVSEIGSFAEFPDDVCLKVPVGAGEEDVIFEYLNLLMSRPDVAKALGARARCYVERECNWDLVAARYAAFLHAVAEGNVWMPPALQKLLTARLREPPEEEPLTPREREIVRYVAVGMRNAEVAEKLAISEVTVTYPAGLGQPPAGTG